MRSKVYKKTTISLSMSNYFKCEPNIRCVGAECCTAADTQPVLSVGDFYRLSKITGEPIGQIWKEKGAFRFSHFDGMENGVFLAMPSLKTEPCTYLTRELRCGVYAQRPLACSAFPVLDFLDPEELAKKRVRYSCTRDVEISQEQEAFARDIDALMRVEAVNDMNFFWRRKPLYISVGTIGAYMELAVQALNLQMARDPKNSMSRSDKLVRAVTEMSDIAEQNKPITNQRYTGLLEPVVYAIHVDDIAERLENLDEALLALYQETTKKYKEILRRL